LDRLGDYLSDHHDLDLLRQQAAEHAKGNKDDGPAIETLLALIDERRSELLLEVNFLGERVYAERRAAFVNRLQRYWQAWGTESKAKPIALNAARSGAAA
jgi:hypothetical protein